MVSTSNSALISLPLYSGFSCSRLSIDGINSISSISKNWVSGQKKIVCNCITPSKNLSDEFSSLKLSGSSDMKLMNSADKFEDDSDVLIECRDVYKSFWEKHILRGVSFKGEVYIRGKRRDRLIGDDEALISGLRIGLVFQSAALFDSLSVRENVGFLLCSCMTNQQLDLTQ